METEYILENRSLVASLNVREYLRLLHLPTTSCILAFAIVGGVAAPVINLDRLLWLLLQLFLVGGVSANFFDEIKGRPWHTKMPETHLWIIGFSALIASSIIGIHLTLTVTCWFWPFIITWGFFAVAYDLELFNGRFHNTPSLALSWGSVCLGSYYLQSSVINLQILILSIIMGAMAGLGRDLYEVAKPFYKDKSPESDETSRFAWTQLKIQILFINLFAITVLMHRILASIGYNYPWATMINLGCSVFEILFTGLMLRRLVRR